MKCRKCGSDNAQDAKFCTLCGEDLSKKPVVKRWFRRFFISIGVIVGIAVIGTLGFFIFDGFHQQYLSDREIERYNWEIKEILKRAAIEKVSSGFTIGSFFFGKMMIKGWSLSGGAFHVSIYNDSRYYLKEINFLLRDPDARCVLTLPENPSHCSGLPDESFKLTFQDDNLMKPYSSLSYSFDVGDDIASRKGYEVGISSFRGYSEENYYKFFVEEQPLDLSH